MSNPFLAAKLVELRKQFKYSQQEIADYLGISRVAYSHYERDTRQPSLEVIVQLSQLYQIDVSELVNEETIGLYSVSVGNAMARTSHVFPMISSGLNPISITSSIITNNITHFLKLFSGKNATIDFTTISKEDIAVLAQYKKLDKQSQKEVRQFIKFKQRMNKE